MMTRMVMLESLENPFIIPLLKNCRMDNPELISSRLPYPIQENETFIIDLNSLAHRKDIFCDDKRSRVMKGNRSCTLQQTTQKVKFFHYARIHQKRTDQ